MDCQENVIHLGMLRVQNSLPSVADQADDLANDFLPEMLILYCDKI